jgi:hypothetical protein
MLRVALNDDESRWRWFHYGRPEFSVELFCPTTSEMNRVAARFRVLNDDRDLKGLAKYIGENWFRDFRGIVDQNDDPLPNTIENRVALLDQVPGLMAWVQGRIADFSAWLDEGNGGSGSVS